MLLTNSLDHLVLQEEALAKVRLALAADEIHALWRKDVAKDRHRPNLSRTPNGPQVDTGARSQDSKYASVESFCRSEGASLEIALRAAKTFEH